MQDEDEGLLLAIEQTVDALTFTQTHVVDNDFRAHSKTTVDSVLSLQEEQRTRVDHAFRAVPAAPQYLAAALLSVYRGEAASVNYARENEPHFGEAGTIDDLSDNQCKAFKKEMKQRIHEWEGAFRDANGREAAPQDKVVLRPIYELYKHAKNRVLRSEGVGNVPMQATQPSQQQSRVHAQQPSTVSQTPSRPQSAPTTSGGLSQQPTPDRGASIYNAVTPASSSVRPTTSAQNVSTPSGGMYTAQGSSPVLTTPLPATVQQQAVNVHPQGSQQQHHVTPVVGSGQDTSVDELVKEKRSIKRLLHQFEASFEQRFGRKPTRDDRREYSREYHRYGELKALLNEHAVMGDHGM